MKNIVILYNESGIAYNDIRLMLFNDFKEFPFLCTFHINLRLSCKTYKKNYKSGKLKNIINKKQ